MKRRTNNNFSIITSLLFLGIFSTAYAREGVGHGGGGEWNVIQCDAHISSGKKLSIRICLTGETNEQDRYEIIPCEGDDSEYVTVERSTLVATDTPMLETVKIPGRLIAVDWTETQFSLEMSDPIAGSLSLVRLGGEEEDGGTTLELNLSSMKHSLRSVSCDFGSN